MSTCRVSRQYNAVSTHVGQLPRPRQLTRREIEVLELLMGGWIERQIAARLGITYWTVRHHVRNMMDKTGAWSQLELGVRVLTTAPLWIGMGE